MSNYWVPPEVPPPRHNRHTLALIATGSLVLAALGGGLLAGYAAWGTPGAGDSSTPAACLQALDDADELIQASIQVSDATTQYLQGGDAATYTAALDAAISTSKSSNYDTDAAACRADQP